MSKRVCKTCGVAEEDHHEPDWLELPDGCVCDWRSWDYSNKTVIPPVCGEYKGDGVENCETCEHDKECHAAKEGGAK
jgi:hypothetical protein